MLKRTALTISDREELFADIKDQIEVTFKVPIRLLAICQRHAERLGIKWDVRLFFICMALSDLEAHEDELPLGEEPAISCYMKTFKGTELTPRMKPVAVLDLIEAKKRGRRAKRRY